MLAVRGLTPGRIARQERGKKFNERLLQIMETRENQELDLFQKECSVIHGDLMNTINKYGLQSAVVRSLGAARSVAPPFANTRALPFAGAKSSKRWASTF